MIEQFCGSFLSCFGAPEQGFGFSSEREAIVGFYVPEVVSLLKRGEWRLGLVTRKC